MSMNLNLDVKHPQHAQEGRIAPPLVSLPLRVLARMENIPLALPRAGVGKILGRIINSILRLSRHGINWILVQHHVQTYEER